VELKGGVMVITNCTSSLTPCQEYTRKILVCVTLLLILAAPLAGLDDYMPQGVHMEQEPKQAFEIKESIEIINEDEKTMDDHVEHVNKLNRKIGVTQLIIGIYIVVNILKGNLEAARSKNPNKYATYRSFLNHENLTVDRRTVRDWVESAATKKELEDSGVDMEFLEYSHFREISKLSTKDARKRVADEVATKALSIKDTQQLVKEETIRSKLTQSETGANLSDLAQEVIVKLNDPVSLSEEEDFCLLLHDRGEMSKEFDFREQAIIYSTAEKIKAKKLSEKSSLEKRLEPVQVAINFLDEMMATMDGKARN
jgi:hypothetical protein